MTTAAVVLHPHPGMGGDSTHPLVTTITDRLVEGGVAAIRPDLSDPDPGQSAEALRGVVDDLVAETGADRLVLIGYSWGSVVSSMVTMPLLVARVLVAPPVGMMSLDGDDGTPTLVLVPAHDQFGGPDAVRDAMGDRDGIEIEIVDGADHFLAGAIDRIATRAVDWVEGRP